MSVHFGFSYVGLIFLIMLFVPNIIWSKNKPKDYEKYVGKENRVLVVLERIGQISVTALALIFDDFNLKSISFYSIFLLVAFILMIMYEMYWVRYFKSEKTMKDFYCNFLGIPLAGAVLPVSAFLLLGIYGKNIFLTVASVVLGIGHIGIHFCHKREIDKM